MIAEQVVEKIGALVDWAASYITRSFPKQPEDHQTVALFKTILMTIDSEYFRSLINVSTSIKQLEMEICQYFSLKLCESKQNILQNDNDEQTPMKTLTVFKIVLQLAYITNKNQCVRAINSLDSQNEEKVTNILKQILNQRKEIPSTRKHTQQDIKRLKQDNKKLRLTLESLKINESQLIQKNIGLERKLKQLQFLNLQKQKQLQESNQRIADLQSIIRQVSLQIYDAERIQKQYKPSQIFNLNNVLQQSQRLNSKQFKSESNEYLSDKQNRLQIQSDVQSSSCYLQKLQQEYNRSTDIVKRFYILKQIHQKFEQRVKQVLSGQ